MGNRAKAAGTWARARAATGGITFALLLFVGACGSQDPTPTPTPPPASAGDSAATGEKAAWQIEWEETLAQAQQEGNIVMVGGSGVRNLGPLWDLFEDAFGIKITRASGSSREISERIFAERAGGQYTVDFFLAGAGTTQTRLIPNGVLGPVRDVLFLPEILDESLWYGGRLWFADQEEKYSLSYAGRVEEPHMKAWFNTNLVTPEEIASITSIWDFLDPKWKGKMVGLAPTEGSATGDVHVAYAHPDIGPEWLRRLITEMDVTWMSDERVMADLLLGGAFPVCLPCSGADGDLEDIVDKGAPVQQLARDLIQRGASLKERKIMKSASATGVLAIVDPAANPNAQRLLANWLLSKQGQTAMHQLIPEDDARTSFRDDVTEPSKTPLHSRRVIGETYLMIDVDPNLPPQTESLEFARRVWREQQGL